MSGEEQSARKADAGGSGLAGDGCGSAGCCDRSPRLDRRGFLEVVGAGAASWAGLAARSRAMAGPFGQSDFDELVPADKKLDPAWVASLFARGEPTVYRGEELGTIGMPVGGICAGHLYLGGDGKLWHWDIFNVPDGSEFHKYHGPHYAKPREPTSPLEQGFAVKITRGSEVQLRTLDRAGFADVSFRGQYPIGTVAYRDDDAPVAVTLEAFSPFVPLDADDSGLPATIMHYTVRNTSDTRIEVELAGWLENAVCLKTGRPGQGVRHNRVVREAGMTLLACRAAEPPKTQPQPKRPDVRFEDFEKPEYEGWTATGTAFGDGPIVKAKMPGYQGDVGSQGKRLVNTHNTRQGEDVRQGDAHVGTLTSRPFTVERNYITFLIGGGAHQGKTCVNLLVDSKVVRSATGKNHNRVHPHSFEVSELAGKKAVLQVVDQHSGGWGNIGLDDVVFSDEAREEQIPLADRPDFGTMALALLAGRRDDHGVAALASGKLPEAVFVRTNEADTDEAARPFGGKLIGAVGRKVVLEPGARAGVTFAVTWHFAHPGTQGLQHITDIKKLRRYYAKRFASATDVAHHLSEHLESLVEQTRLWKRTWYDSTLPYWFLDRTFLNVSTLATATCYRFDNGRFYGWEGTYCCAGTCSHVWQYAQAVGRLFPVLERTTREMVDFGLAFHADTGSIDYRAEAARHAAIDGHAGTILRAYREHQISADSGFLERNWPKIKKAIEFLMTEDGNDDGMLEGAQMNTLDAAWHGQIAWLSGHYVAAVAAGEAMAREAGDHEFAERAKAVVRSGGRKITERLFDGEYFIQRPDPKHPESTATSKGCHIDQVFGQSWAHQVGLGRILPKAQVVSALRALWRYNFTPDIGPYRENFKAIPGGRWYAMPGEAGLLMCTWPKGGAERAAGTKGNATFVAYFNECMTGFEYQVAGHMIWEGLVQEGLAVTRAIHDRYHAARRNPWNEVECSDHYARAMASYGVYVAACGYEYHGPKGYLAFAPRLTPEDFRAAFTAAEGWGTFAQKRDGRAQRETITVKWGRLRLHRLAFVPTANLEPTKVELTVAGRAVRATHTIENERIRIALDAELTLEAGETLIVDMA